MSFLYLPVTFSVDSSILTLCLLEMYLGTKRALEVKKVEALQIKASGLSTSIAKMSQKWKNQSNSDCPLKKGVNQHVNLCPSGSQGMPNPPQHWVGKGLMTAHSPVIKESVASPTLLVKDKQNAIQMAYSIVKDPDLDECLEHETNVLGDFGLFDLMRISSLVVLLVLSCVVLVLTVCLLPSFCTDVCTSNSVHRSKSRRQALEDPSRGRIWLADEV